MRRLLFMPVKSASGLLAGALATRAFERAWRVLDRERPPGPDQRWAPGPKLMLALALEGAIFRGVRASVDHASRLAFRRVTGLWPGEECRSDPAATDAC